MAGTRNANFTTQYQDFLKESYEKESSQRLAWFFKRRSQAVTKPRQLEVFRKKITEGSMPSEALLSRLPKIGGEVKHHRRQGDFDYDMKFEEKRPKVPLQIEMRPASPETWKSLFDGITQEEKGRYQYLLKRYNQIPELKFPHPTLSSWDYGWRLGDIIRKEDLVKPLHGRTRTVHDTFYTRNGVFNY